MLRARIEIRAISCLNVAVLPGYCLRICYVNLASVNGARINVEAAKRSRERPIQSLASK